jgi:inner membrane protein
VDPLSQGLAGAVFAQLAARSRRRVSSNATKPTDSSQRPNNTIRVAALVGAMAGMAPDLDIFIQSVNDPMLSLEYHRHFTHSLLFAPIGGSIVALLVWMVWRKLPFATIWLFAFLGWLSHGLLDLLTSYGTMLLWPLSYARYSLDWVSIIDPAVTAPVLIMVIVATAARSWRWSVAALIWSLAYFSLGAIQHGKAMSIQSGIAAARQHEPVRGRMMPSLGNLLVWRSVYLADGLFHADGIRVGLDGSVQFYPGGTVPEYEPSAAATQIAGGEGLMAYDLARFIHFADRYVSFQGHSANRIVLGDMRYGFPVQSVMPMWGISIDTSQRDSRAIREDFTGLDEGTRQKLWDSMLGEHCEEPECIWLKPR